MRQNETENVVYLHPWMSDAIEPELLRRKYAGWTAEKFYQRMADEIRLQRVSQERVDEMRRAMEAMGVMER